MTNQPVFLSATLPLPLACLCLRVREIRTSHSSHRTTGTFLP